MTTGTLAEAPRMTHLPWRAEALVLVIEHRTCTRCKSKHVTESGVFIRMESSLGGYKRTWLEPPKNVQISNMLRHERRDIHTEINACSLCFVTVPENQLTFWPERFQPQLAYCERIKQFEAAAAARTMNGTSLTRPVKAKKPAPKPLTLDDL